MRIDDKLRKLKPSYRNADLLWLFYLAGEGVERDEVDVKGGVKVRHGAE